MEAWIAQIRFDPAVEAKIKEKHQLTPARIREAVALGAADSVGWHTDPVYGRRLIATVGMPMVLASSFTFARWIPMRKSGSA